jgi:hypothetical protein
MATERTETSAVGAVEPTYRARYRILERLTALVGEGKINGLLVTGQPGLSKTTTVLRTLNVMGLVEGVGFAVYKGHTSPLGLFQTIWNEQKAGNNRIIIFDDCDAALGRDGINLVKAALDDKPKRVVSFISSKLPHGVPTQFEFDGRIIFISNLPLSRLDQAAMDRCHCVEIALSRADLYDFIEHEVLPQDFLTTNLQQRRYVFRRMKAALQRSPVQASVRLYTKLLSLWVHDRDNFHAHLGALLPRNDDLAMLRSLLDRHDTVGDAAAAYAASTKKSTRTFYLLKARYRDLLD